MWLGAVRLPVRRATPTEGGLDRRCFSRFGSRGRRLAALGTCRSPVYGKPGPVRLRRAGQPSTRKNVCTHCSVGCSVIAKVANGVWIGQEPDYDSPINRGSHCCKGAAVRDDV